MRIVEARPVPEQRQPRPQSEQPDRVRTGPIPPRSLLWAAILRAGPGAAAGPRTSLWFAGAADAPPTLFDVVVPADSIDALRGATLDLNRDLLNPGLMMNNPNVPPAPAPPVGMELSGTPAERIRQVLEGQINPSIASHGGRADLVRFDDATGTVELRLSGGCQGCAQSTATLRNGIEGALRSAVPEINEVVDVTDHAGGETPYY